MLTKRWIRGVAAATVLIWLPPLLAQQSTEVREPRGEPWVDMDYGPSLALTVEVGPGNLAYKGLAVRLDEGPGGISQGGEFAVFDTDTLRYAASWMGPQFIDWRCIHFNGEHAVHPLAVGAMHFENPPGPGWAKPGTTDFADDRLVGRDGRHYGPLDRVHAHWKGHYHHGNDVVLSYTVGRTLVLEMPASLSEAGEEGNTELHGFARTLNIGPREQDLVVQIAHDASAEILQHAPRGQDLAHGYVTVTTRNPEATRRDVGAVPQESRGIKFGGESAAVVEGSEAFDLVGEDFTIWAIVATQQDGTVFAKSPAEGRWEPGAKAFFIRNGQLCYDVGWVGVVQSSLQERINNGEPHAIAMTFAHESNMVTLYVDGQVVARDELGTGETREDDVVKLGFASPDFPRPHSAFAGHVAELRFYDRVLDAAEIAAARQGEAQPEGIVAHWDSLQEGVVVDRMGRHHAQLVAARDAGENEAIPLAADAPKLGNVLCIGLVGGPDKCEWITTDDGHVRLAIPAGDDPAHLKVVYVRFEGEEQAARFEQLLADSPPPEVLEPRTHGGQPKWKQSITTKPSVIGSGDGPYVAEEITVPHDNPYRSWMRLGGFDFFEDGRRAAVCTWQGDVWIVEGIGSELDGDSTLSWRRIASGMFQPLGLKIVGGEIYVTCRDQITILRDKNGDRETDFYENFNNDHQVTDHFHEFAVGLQTDAEGNFYYAKCARHALEAVVPHHGTLLKVSKDGSKTEIVARGYRAPNGVCVNDDGTFFLSDQEGHWTPKNRINWVKPGGFYGNMMAYHDHRDADDFEPPVCWMHNDYDRSPAEQVWVTSDKWGLPASSLLTLSYGTGEIHLVLREMIDGQMQGGLVRLPITDFPTGVMRGRFHPGDGQLYACGLFGWSSNKTSPGGFYRIRYTGKPVHMPVQMQATLEGLAITFTEPLDRESATNDRNWTASRWQYRRSQEYGSEDYRISRPQRQGRDRVRVSAVELSDDNRTVRLALEDMRPAMQLEVRYQIKSADGANLSNVIHHTVHRLKDSAISIPEPARLGLDVEERLAGGLAVEFTQTASGQSDARTARLPMLYVPAYEPAAAFLDAGPFQARFRGYLFPENSGVYAFHLAGRGEASLRINGKEVLRGEGDLAVAGPASAELISDYTPLEITYASPTRGAAELRILWERKKGAGNGQGGFGVEPLPPSVLWHDPEDEQLKAPLRLRRGRELFVTQSCIRCHSVGNLSASEARASAELSRKNPDLAGAGSRLDRNWLYRWIADGAAVRNHTSMPQVFGGHLDASERHEVVDLIAYLESLQDDSHIAAEAGTSTEASDFAQLARSGEILFENLGCIACHRFTPPTEEDVHKRTTLYAAGAKYRPGALAAFLKSPHAHYGASGMPDFRLSEAEAEQLAAFIRQRSSWAPPGEQDVPAGDAVKGKSVFVDRGCIACHEAPGVEHSLPPPIPLDDASVQSGCLARTDQNRGKAPVFSLGGDDLDSLAAFLSLGRRAARSLEAPVPVEAAGELARRLRCVACHARDGDFSVLSEVILEEGVQGRPVAGIPSLTWAGEKLQRNWTARLLLGELDYRARGWLNSRMPSFPAYAQALATGLPREHGYEGDVRQQPEPDVELADVGEKLTQQFTGFYCTECHASGDRPPTSAFDHRGIDFSYVTERLQYDYYHRWMHDPARIDPATKMPQFAKQPKPDTLEGDAHRQFDAIWHYLKSLEGHRSP
jgi:mono/diheme cytochrome c family protein